jgi:tRNA(Ile)-lysidine synthase
MGPSPAVAATRLAVRRCLADLGEATVLVACSGGADSLALLSAAVFEARSRAWRVVGAVVDHGLQEDSAGHTARVVEQMAALGADETASIRVHVDVAAGGVEAGAREARYAALTQLASHFGADVVLLGHTLDDQAETVLLGLARGSGGRSIAGMRRGFSVFARPFLDLTRETTEAACLSAGISWWTDPHNSDPRFLRASIRHSVMPVLEEQLGPGVAAALARTAESVREDVDALDDLAEAEYSDLDGTLPIDRLLALPPAIRFRVLRLALLAAGAPGSDLTRAHVLAVDSLIRQPDPTKTLDLPGSVKVTRTRTHVEL